MIPQSPTAPARPAAVCESARNRRGAARSAIADDAGKRQPSVPAAYTVPARWMRPAEEAGRRGSGDLPRHPLMSGIETGCSWTEGTAADHPPSGTRRPALCAAAALHPGSAPGSANVCWRWTGSDAAARRPGSGSPALLPP